MTGAVPPGTAEILAVQHFDARSRGSVSSRAQRNRVRMTLRNLHTNP